MGAENSKVVVVGFNGVGFGNQLFQMAAAMHFATLWQRKVAFRKNGASYSPHSKKTYVDRMKSSADVVFLSPDNDTCDLSYVEKWDESHVYLPFTPPPNDCKIVQMHGYFQNERYVRDNEYFTRVVVDSWLLPSDARKNYSETFFIHVRLGDYVGAPLFDIDLVTNYLPSAMKLIKSQVPDARFRVYSNDLASARKIHLLENSTDVVFVELEDELETLRDMAACHGGGICWNSSFSWWGAYLISNPEKIVTFPNKFLNDSRPIDIYLTNSIILPV